MNPCVSEKCYTKVFARKNLECTSSAWAYVHITNLNTTHTPCQPRTRAGFCTHMLWKNRRQGRGDSDYRAEHSGSCSRRHGRHTQSCSGSNTSPSHEPWRPARQKSHTERSETSRHKHTKFYIESDTRTNSECTRICSSRQSKMMSSQRRRACVFWIAFQCTKPPDQTGRSKTIAAACKIWFDSRLPVSLRVACTARVGTFPESGTCRTLPWWPLGPCPLEIAPSGAAGKWAQCGSADEKTSASPGRGLRGTCTTLYWNKIYYVFRRT